MHISADRVISGVKQPIIIESEISRDQTVIWQRKCVFYGKRKIWEDYFFIMDKVGEMTIRKTIIFFIKKSCKTIFVTIKLTFLYLESYQFV